MATRYPSRAGRLSASIASSVPTTASASSRAAAPGRRNQFCREYQSSPARSFFSVGEVFPREREPQARAVERHAEARRM